MPKYKSVNDEERVYPTIALVIRPGEVVDLAEAIDAAGLELVDEKANNKAKSAPQDEPVVEPTVGE